MVLQILQEFAASIFDLIWHSLLDTTLLQGLPKFLHLPSFLLPETCMSFQESQTCWKRLPFQHRPLGFHAKPFLGCGKKSSGVGSWNPCGQSPEPGIPTDRLYPQKFRCCTGLSCRFGELPYKGNHPTFKGRWDSFLYPIPT